MEEKSTALIFLDSVTFKLMLQAHRRSFVLRGVSFPKIKIDRGVCEYFKAPNCNKNETWSISWKKSPLIANDNGSRGNGPEW